MLVGLSNYSQIGLAICVVPMEQANSHHHAMYIMIPKNVHYIYIYNLLISILTYIHRTFACNCFPVAAFSSHYIVFFSLLDIQNCLQFGVPWSIIDLVAGIFHLNTHMKIYIYSDMCIDRLYKFW